MAEIIIDGTEITEREVEIDGTSAAIAPAQTFTIIAWPDTQYLTESYPSVFQGQVDWINSQIVTRNIKAVLHLGDITDNNNIAEWTVAQYAKNIKNIIMSFIPGNHDLGTNASDRTSLFSAYFNWTDFGPASSRGGYYSEDLFNSYHFFNNLESEWMVLSLEFAPRDAVITWAKSIIEAYPDKKVIINTHTFTYHDNTRYDWDVFGTGQAHSPYIYGVAPAVNDGQQLWNELKGYDNIKLILSGHVLGDGVGTLSSLGTAGNTVNQMLSNYQAADDDHFRIITIDENAETVDVQTYSPNLDSYLTDGANQFELGLNSGGVNYHGLNSLPSKLTINSYAKRPEVRYKGGDADITALDEWNWGPSLLLQAGTPPSFNTGAPPGLNWDFNTDGLLFNEGGFFLSPEAIEGNIGLEDYFWELICYYLSTGGTNRIVDKRVPSNQGWSILKSTNSIRFIIEDTPNNTVSVYSRTIADGYHHFCGYGNRSEASVNGSILYADGIGGTGVDISAVGDIDSSVELAIGATSGGLGTYDRNFIYFALWKMGTSIPAGGAGKTEMDALALARSNLFWGI